MWNSCWAKGLDGDSADRGLSNSWQWYTHTDPGHCCGQIGLPVTEGTISLYPTFQGSFPTPTGQLLDEGSG